MAEVAARAGVTPITVSRALRQPHLVSQATQDRIRESIRELGFIPNNLAGSLRTGTSRIVAAIVPTLRGAVFGRSIEGLSDVLNPHGHQLLTGHSGFSPAKEEVLVREILGWRPAGVVLIKHSHTQATAELLKQNGVPVVELMEYRPRPIDMCVGFSQRRAAAAMTRHLHERGHRRIGFSYLSTRDNERARSRWAGYRQAIRSLGLPFIAFEARDLSLSAGAEALRALREKHPDMDAVFFGSDFLAMGAVQECHRRGIRVPTDLAIAGFDGLEIVTDTYPSLTTLEARGYDIGRRAGEMLLAMVEGKPLSERAVDVGFRIVQREST